MIEMPAVFGHFAHFMIFSRSLPGFYAFEERKASSFNRLLNIATTTEFEAFVRLSYCYLSTTMF